jgi:hypothetical protein
VKDKMVYSSTCKTFKDKLGLSGLKTCEANEPDEMTYEAVKKIVLS